MKAIKHLKKLFKSDIPDEFRAEFESEIMLTNPAVDLSKSVEGRYIDQALEAQWQEWYSAQKQMANQW
ncbi:hypothetical protein [Pseudomonas syringae group sp. J309-1]|uniref:hypothetical protein n=1 Tax=Pseudomonas syringae group sp. J309-1 TaxID=3079588 RepID=UPI00290BF369|nr:hypothetical protein [Pseudomonas syringae group sp. J309-1]MDU8357968.1 hypothetical protein [Pseudomonas syringae group sp. J309-1]